MNDEMRLDALAIGAHPDDVELGCGGTLLKLVSLGYRVGVLDMARGEMGTRGSAEIRSREGAHVAGLAKYDADSGQERFRPQAIAHFMFPRTAVPTFVVDITDFDEQKR